MTVNSIARWTRVHGRRHRHDGLPDLAAVPLTAGERMRRRHQWRRLRRTARFVSWVAGVGVLSFVGIFGLWAALGH